LRIDVPLWMSPAHSGVTALKFDPFTSDAEAAAAEGGRPWPEGSYPGRVVNVTNAISKNNREMLKVKLLVTGPDGSVREITDFAHTAMPKKFKDLCVACGLESEYARGAVDAADFRPEIELKVQLTVERRRGFRPKNSVTGYAPATSVAAAPPLRVVAS
jgi:hypothetical protein